MFDTSEIGTLATLDVGDTGYVTAFGYSAASGGGTESTDSVKVRYTRPGRLKPEVQVAEVRSAATSTVTIDVKDRDLRVTAIDFRKRDGADGGASLSAWIVGGNGWGGSGWYAASGTLGSSTTLHRVLNISVADGTEGEFQWRVVYADDNGNAQTFGDTVKVVNLQESTGSIVVPFSAVTGTLLDHGGAAYGTTPLINAHGYVYPKDNEYGPLFGTVLLPPGVVANNITLVANRNSADDEIYVNFYSVGPTDSTAVSHVSVSHDSTGWLAKGGSIDLTIDEDKVYYFKVYFNPNVHATGSSYGVRTQFRSFKVDYTRPSYKYSY